MMQRKCQQPIVCHGHSRPIVEVNYSNVTPDGYFLVSASKDGQPMLRSGTTGDWIGTFIGHKGCVWSCALDPTATLAATGSADFSAKLWDALTGMEKATLQHKHIVRTCCFSPCSGKLVTGGHEKLLRLFEVERPEAAPFELPGAPSTIKAAVFVGPSDSLLVSSTGDAAGLTVWDVRGGGVVRSMPTDGPVTSVDLTHDGRWLTTTDNRNTVRIWDTSKLDAPAKQFTVTYPAEAASYCPAKNRFAAGGEDMWVHLHSADTGLELETNKGHHGPVHTVRFGPEGKEYASGSEDGTIRIWQTDWLESQAGVADGAAQVAVNAVAPPYVNGAKA
ncbi:hypothetical protein OEZ86_012606 [Tetradesmus obliquus]|uniref:Serine-threonine kinase receptor-associated protein n=1 Tax=Tetradesmus obliquus TaxID=3088 RepID=A0ABY8TY80_TETOB|nr:hypothetical protein OEZ85_002643 [Tetradesmus obliquus]WIA34256.1 hypothetical protein OEZ86_012606 [Tetradesmus obliquus]